MLKVMLFSLYQLDSISRHLLALGSRREPALQKNHRCPFSADGRDLSPSTMDVDYEDDAVEVRESKCFFSRRLHGYFSSPRNGSVENGSI